MNLKVDARKLQGRRYPTIPISMQAKYRERPSGLPISTYILVTLPLPESRHEFAASRKQHEFKVCDLSKKIQETILLHIKQTEPKRFERARTDFDHRICARGFGRRHQNGRIRAANGAGKVRLGNAGNALALVSSTSPASCLIPEYTTSGQSSSMHLSGPVPIGSEHIPSDCHCQERSKKPPRTERQILPPRSASLECKRTGDQGAIEAPGLRRPATPQSKFTPTPSSANKIVSSKVRPLLKNSETLYPDHHAPPAFHPHRQTPPNLQFLAAKSRGLPYPRRLLLYSTFHLRYGGPFPRPASWLKGAKPES